MDTVPNLRFVETLREVAEHGSFSAAADALHLTQPAVSRQVALLEAQAGMPLVLRSRRGVRLTAAGRLVVEHAEGIHARLLALGTELAALADGTRVTVALGGFPTAFAGLLPAIVRSLRERVADADIQLHRCGHEEGVARVRRGDLDLALVFESTTRQPTTAPDDVTVVRLADEPMLALLSRAHRLAEAPLVELADLRDEEWIVGAPDPSSSVIADACRAAGFEPRVAHETDDALAIQGLVGARLGVSLTTPWMADGLRADVVLRPLAPPVPTRRVSAIVADPAGPGARLLLELARAAAAQSATTGT